MKVFLTPTFRGPDNADGGVRRVLEAQTRWLPTFGIELVPSVEEADLVHAHITGVKDVPVDKPYLLSTHGLYWAEYDWPSWAYRVNQEVIEAMRRADHVTAPSEWVAQALRRGMWLSPTVLYHGVNPEEWEPGRSEGYVLWNKARQDVYSTPEPVNELARRDESLRFVSTFGEATANVQITGAMPYHEMQGLVKRAGVYLSTTRETLGIGTLEAMAAGVPVVGWAWGGNREIVRHGVTGWLARPGDYDGLLEGIRWALANRATVGEAARAEVLERWTWRTAIERHALLYRSIVAGHAAKREGPRVSVVVPCYNLARYLPETLRSVQAQTEQDWECTVVDDASTDDTAAVVAEFTAADPRIRYLRNERNLHVSATRNRGIAASRGRYIVPVDADDCIAPQTLEVLAAALDADRGLGIAYGGLQVMSEAGVLRDQAHDWPPAFDFREQIQGRNQVPTMCMFRREMFERTGGYRSRISPVEDADLWTRATSIGFVARKVTDAPLLLYRLRSGSLSRSMPNPQWVDWYPWSRQRALVPFGAAVTPPPGQQAWPVPSYEPAKVAVIIPVGPGHESLLIDAVDSVEAQTLRQWECVVVNDTGGPLPFVPSWARVLETQGKVGPAAARNLGVAATTAPLLVFLDADDYLQPDALESLVAAQRQYGGVVYPQWYDDFGKASDSGRIYDPPEYDAKLLTRKGCIHAVTAIYPRSAFLDVGGFDEKLTHWEDWDLQIALASRGVCGTKLPRPLFTYRKNTGSRREENHAAFEAGKTAVLKKWGRFWESEELMACRSCPGGGGAPRPAAPPAMMMGSDGSGAGAPQEGATLLEFLGPSPAVTTYAGKGTGARYRFGNTPTARLRYVLNADVPGMLAFKDRFRVVTPAAAGQSGPSPQLTAIAPASASVATQVEPPLIVTTTEVEAVYVSAPAQPQPLQKRERPDDPSLFSLPQIRGMVPNMTEDELAVWIAKERQSETPREGVIRLLQVAMQPREPVNA